VLFTPGAGLSLKMISKNPYSVISNSWKSWKRKTHFCQNVWEP